MTSGNVDEHDMLSQDPLDEETLEAFLSGQPRPGELAETLATFSHDVETVVSGPAPEPKGNLAALLREGFSPNGAAERAGSPVSAPGVVAPAPTPALPEAWAPVPRQWVEPPPQGSPSSGGGRPRSLKLLPRLAGLGMVAKVGLGLGAAAASVTVAGAAGVLPQPAQNVVATFVDTVTPFELPESTPSRPAVDPPRGVPAGKLGGEPSGGLTGGDGITGNVEGPIGGGFPPVPGVGRSPDGATGLNRANQTPAAGNVPPSVPVPTTTFSSGQQGLDRANETPAAGNVPTSVPVPTTLPGEDPGGKGKDKEGQTPPGDEATTTTSSTTTTIAP